MSKRKLIWGSIIIVATVGLSFGVQAIVSLFMNDPFEDAYVEHCSACHGSDLAGATLGPALVGDSLLHGEEMKDLIQSISQGFPLKGMPSFADLLTPSDINKIAIFVKGKRLGYDMGDFRIKGRIRIPEGLIHSETHTFKVETVAEGLDPWPYSIAPLPDGRILLTEKRRGIRIVSQDGMVTELLKGTPRAYDDDWKAPGLGLTYGKGWILDIALHPDYEQNGWIYLSFGDRCEGCNEISRKSKMDVSMVKLVRGRIKDLAWTDEETIWEVDKALYTTTADISAGGRICFDRQGHIFLSVGSVGPYVANPPGTTEIYLGTQDLSTPYGKIHRLMENGAIPKDNPFVDSLNVFSSTWTYGHRSPQGLEYDSIHNQLWGTEMGPRGGDEVNLLLAGKNYGWPLFSKGINYNGSPVEYGKYLGIEVDLAKIEQPIVDFTPSPAVSSFIIYGGELFPQWKGNFIMGSLKASTLFRLVIQDNQLVHKEVLIDNFVRIRDIEQGGDGLIYLLLEHSSGGQIVRIVPGNN